MVDGVPSLKASHFACEIRALAILGEREHEARRQLAPIIAELEMASRVDFVPVEWDLAVTRVAFAIGGTAAVRAVNQETFRLSAGGPLLRPLFGTALRVFGVQPSAMLKVVGHSWSAASRNLGTIHIRDVADGSCTLEHVDLPLVVQQAPYWAEGQIGLFEGICGFVGHRCTGATVHVPTPSVHRYEFTWQKA
jgi:hypothetical protein